MAKSTDMNVREVTLNEAAERVALCVLADLPVFLWGPAGIGKSEFVHQVARENDGVSIDLRMANLQPTDLMGIPYYEKEQNTMSWAHPSMLPVNDIAAEMGVSHAEFAAAQKALSARLKNSNRVLASKHKMIVLFLDELNTAPPATQAAAYQLVLDRAVGEYKLPSNVRIICAGNREQDSGVTYKMPAPLRNRLIHLEVRSDFESWFSWATTIGDQHPDVIGYIAFKKDNLSNFDPKSSSRAFATPRSWSFVSRIIRQAEAMGADQSTVSDLIAGAVGDGIAVQFQAYKKIGKSLPSPTEILSGKVTKLVNRDIAAQYSLIMSLCYEMRELWRNDSTSEGVNSKGKETRRWKSTKVENEWMAKVDHFITFVMDNFETELAIMGARIAMRQYELPFLPGKLKGLQTFIGRYGKFIIDAAGSASR